MQTVPIIPTWPVPIILLQCLIEGHGGSQGLLHIIARQLPATGLLWQEDIGTASLASLQAQQLICRVLLLMPTGSELLPQALHLIALLWRACAGTSAASAD